MNKIISIKFSKKTKSICLQNPGNIETNDGF